MTLLRNGRLITLSAASGSQESKGTQDIRIVDGYVSEIGQLAPLSGETVHDLDGATVAPGLIDLQCNGALGIDLTSTPERIWELSAHLPRWGVTAWAPTIVTSSPEIVDRAISTVQAGPPPDHPAPSAAVLGLHLEGPCLNPLMAGAHQRSLIRNPASTDTRRWTKESVALVTIAPEMEGAPAMVAELRRRGITVSIGHSAATAEQVRVGVEAGASMATHLFNAMSPLHHRQPGVVGAVLADESLHASLICDGVHVDPSVVTIAYRLLGSRLILVSDAVAALGLPPGRVRLGSVELIVTDTDVRLADGTLAGSNLSLDTAVRNLIRFTGCTLTEAIHAATRAPAGVIGRADLGVVEAGKPANLVVLNDGLVRATYVNGQRWVRERSVLGPSV